MPVAVFNYLFAVRANRSPEQVASLVMCSTLLAIVWLPLILAWWMPRVN
jgi:predicted permease